MDSMYLDNYLNYYAVVEQTSPENSDTKIITHHEDPNGLNYLRFSTCLQTFGKRNRNRRLWLSEFIKKMLSTKEVGELLRRGFPGENGHPVPSTGQVTMERILTIDPNNMSHKIMSFDWKDPNTLYGVIETLDEGPGSPGFKFMRNILQKMDPSFSLRSIVPQRKNADGSIDVTGPGRLITYDRVILPSHEEAYIDKSIPIQNIVTKNEFQTVMESFTNIILEDSEKVNRIIDKAEPAMESASLDKNGVLSIHTENEGRLFIVPETKYRKEIAGFMRDML